jgi:hypothetical protein
MRTLIHIPVGAFNAWLLQDATPTGVIFFAGFMIYQLDECLHIKDQAWLDIKGYLWGLAIAAYILMLW